MHTFPPLHSYTFTLQQTYITLEVFYFLHDIIMATLLGPRD